MRILTKKKIIAILFVLVTSFCFGQKVKHVIVRFPKSKQISKSYYVLKSNKKIKNGEYISYFKLSETDLQLAKKGIIDLKDYIKEKGNYVNNKKEGEWIENISPLKSKKGKYVHGKKVGIWNTYYENNKIASYDYDLHKKVGIWLTRKENGKVYERFDYDNNIKLQPIIPIHLFVSYPERAKENEIEGIVKISFQINNDCSISNIKIIEGLSKECDNASIDAIKEYGRLLKKYGYNCKRKVETQKFIFRLH